MSNRESEKNCIKAAMIARVHSIVSWNLEVMWFRTILVATVASLVVFGDPEPGINGDVDVFNKNFNKKQHNARDLVFRVLDVIPPRPEPSWKASATLSSDNPEQSMTGEITFKQWNINAPVMVSMNISGLSAGKHSVHIHAFGDTTDGCKSTGPHFRSSVIGNIEAKDGEDVNVTYETWGISLFGLSGILGRSVVIHEKASGECQILEDKQNI
jgi:Cu/Zn superoxide dismutase